MNPDRIEWLINNYKKLSEYTDDELNEFLNNNQILELSVLAGICSEVLRRMIKK